jgi:hypothetical protein
MQTFWEEEDQDDAGSDDNEEGSTGEDDDIGNNSDGSSEDSDDEKSTKTEATNNRPKKKNNDSVRPVPGQQKNTTTDQNSAAMGINMAEPKSGSATATTEIVKPSIFLRQRKRTPTANLTKEEALAHTQARIDASQQEHSERAERKRQMGIPSDLAITSSDDETMTTPPKARSRLRSPGNTPENEKKMQRTSTAPSKPSTQDELARALDYSFTTDETQDTKPSGNRRRRGKQEK